MPIQLKFQFQFQIIIKLQYNKSNITLQRKIQRIYLVRRNFTHVRFLFGATTHFQAPSYPESREMRSYSWDRLYFCLCEISKIAHSDEDWCHISLPKSLNTRHRIEMALQIVRQCIAFVVFWSISRKLRHW